MRAVVVEDADSRLVVREVPLPVPGRGEVVVQLEVAGVCEADARAGLEGWPRRRARPFVPGHEGVGVVASVGRDVVHVREGDRVVLPLVSGGCRACEFCVPSPATRCPHYFASPVAGTLAEYAKASAAQLEEVPSRVDPLDAVPLACAGIAAYRAVDLLRAYSSELTLVFGVDTVGYLAVQYAKLVGLTVVAVDRREERLDLATAMGADYVVNATDGDVVSEVRALGGADSAICAAEPAILDQASACVEPGVVVAMTLPPGAPSGHGMTWKAPEQVAVVNRLVPTGFDLAEVFALHAAGLTRLVRESCPLGDVNDALEHLKSGEALGHVVFDLRADTGWEKPCAARPGRSSASSKCPPQLMRPVQAAGYLGVDTKTLSRWSREGRLPSVMTPGGHRRFLLEDIVRFAEIRRRGQPHSAFN